MTFKGWYTCYIYVRIKSIKIAREHYLSSARDELQDHVLFRNVTVIVHFIVNVRRFGFRLCPLLTTSQSTVSWAFTRPRPLTTVHERNVVSVAPRENVARLGIHYRG
jgi:hypothetical protein